MTNPYKQKIIELVSNNKFVYTREDVAKMFGIKYEAVRNVARQNNLSGFFKNNSTNRSGGIMEVEAIERSSEMQDPSEKELAYYRRLFKENGLDFKDYPYFWDKKTLEGMSLFYRNPDAVKADKESMDSFFNRIKEYAPKYPTIKYRKVKDGHLKLIDIADLHIGKYAVSRDNKVCYDIPTAVSMAKQAVDVLLQRSQGFPTDRFLFPVGNDILHVDNKNNTTTKGTSQSVHGSWWEMYDAAHALYVSTIERLVQIAPVQVVYNRSNHDEHSGFSLARGLQHWFRHNKNVTFVVSTNDREYVEYGKNMIGMMHGDGAKLKDLPLLMAAEAPKIWGESVYRHIICHHIHHWQKHSFLLGMDMPGVTVQYMRSPSASDDWHQKMGYTCAPQAIDALIFHPEHGQVDHMSCVFNK